MESDMDQEKETELSSEEKIKKVLEKYIVSITFYGKVVDEKGNPVEGATAFFSVNDLSENSATPFEIKSDDEGLFSLRNVKGGGTSVRVFKDGHYTSPTEYRYFDYNRESASHVPDANNPVIFQLRKKGEAAELVHREKLFTFTIDGTVHYIDLLTGKKYVGGSSQGDFSVRIIRSQKSSNDRFDWEVVLEAVGDGGFIESTEEFMLQAPEDGYQPVIHIGYNAPDANWRSEERRKFYLRSRAGKFYTRLETTIIPEYNNKGAIDLNYYLNPDKSRNLEYDKSKEIEVKVK